METAVGLIAACLALAVVLLAVLLLRARETAARAQAQLEQAEAQAQVATSRLDAANDARHSMELELAAARERLSAAEHQLSAFDRLREESLQATKAALLETAQTLSSKLIDDHKRESDAQREAVEARVKAASEHLVKQVDDIAKAVSELNGQVQDKGRLLDTVWRSLSSPSGAGQIAEIGLANTLRGFGLEAGRDYVLQAVTDDAVSGQRLRPDALVFLPGDHVLVIDVKASKYLMEIAAAEGADEEDEAYANLARTMNQHLKALTEKDYRGAVIAAWRAAGRGREIVRVTSIMYLPNESAVDKLGRADPSFLQKARNAQILPAGPAGLHCALSLAAVEITSQRQVENQQRIAEGTQALLESMALALGHVAAVGRGLRSAAENFAKLGGSVNQRLLPRARKLVELGIRPVRALPGNLPTYDVIGRDPEQLIEGEASEVPIDPPQLAN